MKKLKLRIDHLGNNDVLSREQLKMIVGGSGSGSGGYDNAYLCGTQLTNGQCYCDFCDNVTHFPIYCGVPCPISPCRLP